MRGTGCERGYEIYPLRPSNENFLTYITYIILRILSQLLEPYG